jgi:hypothetical protein
VNTTGTAGVPTETTIFCDTTRFVSFKLARAKVEELPGNNGADKTSCVSFDWKLQVPPGDEAEQTTAPSLFVKVRVVKNVITLSIKQANSGLVEISVPAAVAL